MRKVIVQEFMSLDGVVQAPGGDDEDTSGGFRHGGWQMDYLDDASVERILAGIHAAGGFLLGRGTYEIFASYWPHTGRQEAAAFAEPLNSKPKWVASRTLSGELEWEHATLLSGDAAEAVAELKAGDGGDLHVIGSPGLVRSLIAADLVDELQLVVYPLVLGGGKRILSDDGELRRLRLVEATPTSTGAIHVTYAPA